MERVSQMAIPPVKTNQVLWLSPLLVSILTFIVFTPALKNEFLNWDDIQNLADNKEHWGLGYEQLKWMFTSYNMGPYAPITLVTTAIDYIVWGMNPFGYHLTNVLIHSLNALVFCFLCIKLLALPAHPSAPDNKQDLYISAGFAALFFSIHPLRVESASWLSGRHDLLSCLFYLLSIIFYITPRSADGENPRFWRRHILPLLFFLLALMSKGMAVSLPLVLVVLDLYPLQRLTCDPRKWLSREPLQIWLEKIPYFLLAAIFGAVGYACQAKSGALASYQVFGAASRIAQSIFATFFYVQKTIIPTGLSPLYRLPDGFGLLNWQTILAGAGITAITLASIALRRSWPGGLTAWACYLITLSPVVGIVKINSQAAADRYTYIPCLAFAILAGGGLRVCLQTSSKRLKNTFTILAFLAIVALSGLTWRQEGIWRNSETLWRHALALNKELDFAHNNLGIVLAAQGKTDEAIMHYREALRLKPDYAIAHYDLGGALTALGKLDEAVLHYREALRINPGFEEAHYNLGIVLAAQGKSAEAAAHYREALRINPNDGEARTKLDVVLTSQNKKDKTVGHYQEADISTTDAQAHIKLGIAMAAQGKTDEAARHYREALKVNQDSAQAHNNLGLILTAQGKIDEAIKHYQEALKINPDYSLAHNNLGLIMAAQGKTEEAEKEYREALRINPASAEAHYNLSLILAAQGKTEEASMQYREALRINPYLKIPAPNK